MSRLSLVSACVSTTIFVFSFAIAGSALAIPAYEIIDLGDFAGGAEFGYATGINNLGQVIGVSHSAMGARAYIWDSQNGMRDLGMPATIPPDRASHHHFEATEINDAGIVVGFVDHFDILDGPRQRGFVWDETNGMRYLPGVDSSLVFDINNSGWIVGTSGSDAVLWTSFDAPQDLGDLLPGVSSSSAAAVNNAGVVIGGSTGPDGPHGVIWHPGGGTTKLNGITAIDVNDNGDVVGTIGDRLVLYREGQLIDLGTFPGFVGSMNNHRQIVGTGTAGAFLWDPLNGFVNLTDLVTQDGWRLTSARAINDRGQIVGWGHKNGVAHGVLLTPVSEPSALAVLVSGLLGFTFLVGRRKARLMRGHMPSEFEHSS